MDRITASFSVRYQYPVVFTRRAFDPANPLVAQLLEEGGDAPSSPRLLAVLDRGVAEAHPKLPDAIGQYGRRHGLELAGDVWIVPGGEAAKNDHELVASLHEAIDRGRICRHSYVVAIGGGAVLDMAGYAAATAHRGVRLVRMPTTVLAQNDAGIGVKNGVNACAKKNFVGTFAPPRAVINDFEFLRTLENRDWRAGIAEAVKVALIRDQPFFEFIAAEADALRGRAPEPMERLIRRCAELHLQHIATAGDPFEHGSSRPLDFGHWAAHRLEALSAYRLRHGEAVALGIALDTVYSMLAGWLAPGEAHRIVATLERIGFDTFVPELAQPSLLEGLDQFREHLGGELTVTLLKGIGRGFEVHSVGHDRYRAAIEWLEERAAGALLPVATTAAPC